MYTCTTEMFSRTLHAQHPATTNLHISPRFLPTIFYRYANSVLLLAHLCTAVVIGSTRRTLCSKLFVRRARRSIYTRTNNENVHQNSICVESCVTKEFSIFPRFSPTMFDPDANLVLLRAHLCTEVDSMRRKPCVRNFSRERERLYNGNVLLAHLCTAVLIGYMRRTLLSKLFMMRA